MEGLFPVASTACSDCASATHTASPTLGPPRPLPHERSRRRARAACHHSAAAGGQHSGADPRPGSSGRVCSGPGPRGDSRDPGSRCSSGCGAGGGAEPQPQPRAAQPQPLARQGRPEQRIRGGAAGQAAWGGRRGGRGSSGRGGRQQARAQRVARQPHQQPCQRTLPAPLALPTPSQPSSSSSSRVGEPAACSAAASCFDHQPAVQPHHPFLLCISSSGGQQRGRGGRVSRQQRCSL